MVTQSLSGGEQGQRGTLGPDCRPPVPHSLQSAAFVPFDFRNRRQNGARSRKVPGAQLHEAPLQHSPWKPGGKGGRFL